MLLSTVSPKYVDLQVVTFQRYEHVLACPIPEVSSHVVYIVTWVHLLRVVIPVCTLQYCIEHSSAVSLFQVQDVEKQSIKAVVRSLLLLRSSKQ